MHNAHANATALGKKKIGMALQHKISTVLLLLDCVSSRLIDNGHNQCQDSRNGPQSLDCRPLSRP
jgi:hypothetical protein